MADYVLDRLIEAGNTVAVIEHNLDVIKNADGSLVSGRRAAITAARSWLKARQERLPRLSDLILDRW